MRLAFLFILITLTGCDKQPEHTAPNPKDFTPQARYERAMAELKSATTNTERFYALTDASITSFEIGNIDDAKEYSNELLELAPLYKTDWNYGNAIHKGNIVLGRIAVTNNEIDKAKAYLLKAGDTPGSPQLNSFGPNMTLAKDLLVKSENKVVIEYLEKCKKFWEMDRDRLDFWIFQINKGKTPEFGANLLY